MKMHLIFKYVGMISGIIGIIMVALGTIGFFIGEVLNVKHYDNFFWHAEVAFFMGIFGMVVYIACKDKEKK